MAVSQVSNVVSQLTNPLIQEAIFLLGVKDQVERVRTELQRMKGFLKDAESRRKGDERVENWIREIRDVAYEVEDIIDRVMFTAERQRQRRGFMGTISRYYHKLCEWFTLHKIGSEIGKIEKKIHCISESRATYGIVNLGESSAVDGSSLSLRESSPLSNDDNIDVIGFEHDKKEIVSQLLDGNEKKRCVISIVGMGGLGKTTLARKVYKEITKHFDTFAWVSVSQSYRGIELVKDIMKKIMGIKREELEQMGEEEVKKKLRDFLGDKKYLVVMDDVWRVDVWREMQRVFPDENRGSRILLTTRNKEVAKDAEPWIPPHELHLLDDTESWKLFRRKALPPNQDVPTELEALAQKLAKKCGGLPLALVVLGALLSKKDRSYHEWSRVDQIMNWASTRDGKECHKIVGLSYNDLPYPLKPCFLYIAAFPEDSIISVSKLVRLWVAEGFILQEQRQTMEDTARDWLDELVQRCMIQVVYRSPDRRRVTDIRIHDLLRDFGLEEAKKDEFLHVCSSVDMATSDRISSHRAAFYNRINDEAAVSSRHLRTLLGFDLVLKGSTAAGRFLNELNKLRVLDLESAIDLKELPKQIGSMIHLRYLGLRRTGLKRLPSSIRHLLNLQTLDVSASPIIRLPKSFWKIRTLRHVYINTFMFLSAPISGDHKDLQTLRIEDRYDMDNMDMVGIVRSLGVRFIKNWLATPGFTREAIDKARERMIAESLREALEKMDSLVDLALILHRHIVPGDVLFARAPNLHQLHSLTLWGRLLLKQQLQLPDSSQFPPNLTKLILSDTFLEQDPMPVLEKLRNLSFLKLDGEAYVGKSMLCSSAGGFPQLQHLMLTYLNNLEEWRVEAGAMPSLTELSIIRCTELKMLPEGLQHVTTLRELKLIDLPHEFNDRVRNEDVYKVRHIPSIIFEFEQL